MKHIHLSGNEKEIGSVCVECIIICIVKHRLWEGEIDSFGTSECGRVKWVIDWMRIAMTIEWTMGKQSIFKCNQKEDVKLDTKRIE